jgi:hypothetical protein
MTAKRSKTSKTGAIEIGLGIALSEYYRGVLATRLRLSLAKHYAGSASRLVHGELRDVVRGDRRAFAKAAEKVRGEDANLRDGAVDELRTVYPRLLPKLGARLNDDDSRDFWSMVDAAIFPAKKVKRLTKPAGVKVTKIGRLWVADRRCTVAVFSGVHSQGSTRHEALANLENMIASLRKEGGRLARQKWIGAITDDKLRAEVMRLVLARGAVDARDFNARARKELARIDAASKAAIEAVRAGRVGTRVLRKVEDCKDNLDDLIQMPVLHAQLREIHEHPERLIPLEVVARRYGITLAPSTKRQRGRKS